MKSLQTERLILRPWRETDAEALFAYARDDRVGPAAGWPVHSSPEDSRKTIQKVLSKEGILAVTLRGGEDVPIGSVGLQNTTAPGYDGEREIGYWIGVPFWGKGLIPEAVRALLRYAFEEERRHRVWCSHFSGNDKSRRVIEKCGFSFVFERPARSGAPEWAHTECYYSITREEYLACRVI